MALQMVFKSKNITTNFFGKSTPTYKRSFSLGAQTNWRGRSRFYGEVQVINSQKHPGQFEIELDGRKLRTPSQQLFQLPTKGLATLVAQEWDAQVCVIETSTMPMTMNCAVAIDITSTKRPAIIAELLRYLNTDIVCFPQRLLSEDEQEEISGERKRFFSLQIGRWQKSIDHFQDNYGKLEILDSDTLRSPNHEPTSYANTRFKLEALNDLQLTAIHQLAQGCKSLVLPIALCDRVITVTEAFDAARAEEDHQIQNWGLVEGAHDVDKENLMVQISAASLLLWLS
jgi:ATP synthase F1 complex assembly factor 2